MYPDTKPKAGLYQEANPFLCYFIRGIKAEINMEPLEKTSSASTNNF
jgi:hypothetical protein